MSQFTFHNKTQGDLDAIVANPTGAYLLVGRRWSGKRQSAEYITTRLNCGVSDVLRLQPNEKGTIGIEDAHRLVTSLSRRPHSAEAHRVVVIESAQSMTVPTQNALLKLIEEPPAKTIFLLLVSSADDVLPTIKSRSQIVYMRPISSNELIRGRAGLAMELQKSAEQHDIQMDIKKRAEEILSAPIFERMLLVDKLASDKNRNEVIDWLAYLVSKRARVQNTPSQSLQSVQNYFIYGNAGVAQKHALTEMMIRL